MEEGFPVGAGAPWTEKPCWWRCGAASWIEISSSEPHELFFLGGVQLGLPDNRIFMMCSGVRNTEYLLLMLDHVELSNIKQYYGTEMMYNV